MERQQSRYYKNISLFLKLAIVGLAFGFIYKQVFYRPLRDEIFSSFTSIIDHPPFVLLATSVILMFVNWGIEALKWKLVVQKTEDIPFGLAVKAVLSGVTIGSFTPNRFGEFAGRIFYLQRTDRIDGILMTFTSSASQLLVTVAAGCAGFWCIEHAQFSRGYFYGLAITLSLFTLLLLWMYFNLSLFAARLVKVKFLKRYSSHISMLCSYSKQELLNVFLFSMLRYAVFTMQFYLLLKAFNVEIGLSEGFVSISLTYLVITVIPTVALAELGIRGSAALACIGLYSDNGIGIIAASFTLWIINIALPAIAGAFFVFGLKFFREKS